MLEMKIEILGILAFYIYFISCMWHELTLLLFIKIHLVSSMLILSIHLIDEVITNGKKNRFLVVINVM